MKLNPKIAKAALTVRKAVVDNAPAALTGLAVGGYLATAAEAIHATVKAVRTWDDLGIEKLTKDNAPDVAVEILPHYVPTVILATISTACCLGARNVSSRRYAALSAAYAIAEEGLKDWQGKTEEVVGEKKAQKIQDEIARKKIQEHGFRENIAIETGHGHTLCYDGISGRYFYSDMERLRQAQNDVNEMIIGDWSATLNDFYDAIGLPRIDIGEDLGWNTAKLVKLKFTSDLVSNGTPVLVVQYDVYPEYRDL